jgi:hypothetical protein
MRNDWTWQDVVSDVCAVAADHGATTRVSDREVVITGGPIIPYDPSVSSIVVSHFEENSARVKTGWFIDCAMDFDIYGDRTRPGIMVDAIMTGRAEEAALLDADDHWVGVEWEVVASTGDGWHRSGVVQHAKRAVRRIPAWA